MKTKDDLKWWIFLQLINAFQHWETYEHAIIENYKEENHDLLENEGRRKDT